MSSSLPRWKEGYSGRLARLSLHRGSRRPTALRLRPGAGPPLAVGLPLGKRGFSKPLPWVGPVAPPAGMLRLLRPEALGLGLRGALTSAAGIAARPLVAAGAARPRVRALLLGAANRAALCPPLLCSCPLALFPGGQVFVRDSGWLWVLWVGYLTNGWLRLCPRFLAVQAHHPSGPRGELQASQGHGRLGRPHGQAAQGWLRPRGDGSRGRRPRVGV